MYEFLAPWGVLVPAISAFAVYIAINELRWRRAVRRFEERFF